MSRFILCATDKVLETALAEYLVANGLPCVGTRPDSDISLAELNAEMLSHLGVREWYREHADTGKLDANWVKRANGILSRFKESESLMWIDSTALATADFWLELDIDVSFVFAYDDAATFLSRVATSADELVPGILREYLKRRVAILDIADLVKDRFPERVHLIDVREPASVAAFTRGRGSLRDSSQIEPWRIAGIDPVKRVLYESLLGSAAMRLPKGSSLRWIGEPRSRGRNDDSTMDALRDYYEQQQSFARIVSVVDPDDQALTEAGKDGRPLQRTFDVVRRIEALVEACKSSAATLPEMETVEPVLTVGVVDQLRAELATVATDLRVVREEISAGAVTTGRSLQQLKIAVEEVVGVVAAAGTEVSTESFGRARGVELAESYTRARGLIESLNGLAQRVLISLSESEALLNSEYEKGVMARQLAQLERELAAARQHLGGMAKGAPVVASDLLQEFWRHQQPEDLWIDLRREFSGRNWYSSEPDGRWMGPGLVGEITLPLVRPGVYRFELEIVDAMADACIQSLRMGLGREFAKPDLQDVLSGGKYPVVGAFTAEVVADTALGYVVLLVSTADAFRPSDSGLEDSRLLSIKCRTLRVQFCGAI